MMKGFWGLKTVGLLYCCNHLTKKNELPVSAMGGFYAKAFSISPKTCAFLCFFATFRMFGSTFIFPQRGFSDEDLVSVVTNYVKERVITLLCLDMNWHCCFASSISLQMFSDVQDVLIDDLEDCGHQQCGNEQFRRRPHRVCLDIPSLHQSAKLQLLKQFVL